MVTFAKKRFYCHAGSPDRTVFRLGIDKVTGAQEVFPVGKEDFSAMIQSYAQSCDLSVIIARVRAGELDLLHQRQGLYADVTSFPQTLQEVLQTRIDAKVMFDRLPVDVKKNFGDFESFCSDAGSLEWLKNLGYVPQENIEVKEGEKVNAES